ncbi:DUF3311 domain-containing protein [Streptomyces sp. QTS137]
MSQAPDSSRGPVVTPARVVIGVCLAAPFVAMLWVGSYARTDPTFIGIPFFYWYQMLWVLVSTALTVIAYKLWQRDQRVRAAAKGGARR